MTDIFMNEVLLTKRTMKYPEHLKLLFLIIYLLRRLERFIAFFFLFYRVELIVSELLLLLVMLCLARYKHT